MKRHRLSCCQNDAVLISAWSKRRRFDPGRKKKIKTAPFQSQPGRNGVVLGLLLQFINRPVSGSGRSRLQKKKKKFCRGEEGTGGRRSDHLTWRKPDSHLGRIQTSALAPLSFGLPSKQQNFYKSGIFWLRKSGLGVKKTGFFERFFFCFEATLGAFLIWRVEKSRFLLVFFLCPTQTWLFFFF